MASKDLVTRLLDENISTTNNSINMDIKVSVNDKGYFTVNGCPVTDPKRGELTPGGSSAAWNNAHELVAQLLAQFHKRVWDRVHEQATQ
jgi:hypothetical protein